VKVGGFARALARLWFRKARVTGPALPPGAVLLVLNHPNGLLDPLVPAALLDPPPRFMAKATLWKILPLRPFLVLFNPIPVRRAQDEEGDSANRTKALADTFEAVHQGFREGQRVAMFPEGISHGESDLAPLKTGAARLALSCPTPLSLVPAGLVYGRRDLFRHSVLLRLGEPIPFVDLQGPGAVATLTDRIRQALLPLTLHAEAEDLLSLAQDTAWLLAEGPRSRTDLEAHRVRVRALLDRLQGWKPHSQEALRLQVGEARTWLRSQGLRPDQVGHPYPWDEVARWLPRMAVRHGAALVLLPLALAFWPPYALVRWLAGRLTDELDQTATFKLLGGFLFHPLWCLGLAVFAWWQGGVWGLAACGGAGLAAVAFLPLLERLREDWQAIRGFLNRKHPHAKVLLGARERLLAAFPELTP
jgi:1-acyl-sn-glycerol-3-phosphate acyltransferase